MFTIRVIYNDRNSKSLSEARATKWKQMKNKGTLRIPPDSDSFEQRLKRANYLSYIWFNYYRPDAPNSPLTHGFILKTGDIVLLLHTLSAMPENIKELFHNLSDNELDASFTDSDSCDSDFD